MMQVFHIICKLDLGGSERVAINIAKHKENGYLVEEQTAEAFAEGIHWALTEGQKKDRRLLRKSVEKHFSEEAVTRQFLDLYNR